MPVGQPSGGSIRRPSSKVSRTSSEGWEEKAEGKRRRNEDRRGEGTEERKKKEEERRGEGVVKWRKGGR